MDIDEIKSKIFNGEYRFSDHAIKRLISRYIDRIDIESAVMRGKIFE